MARFVGQFLDKAVRRGVWHVKPLKRGIADTHDSYKQI